MRLHFFSRLALLLMGAFGVVATQVYATHAWSEGALELIFIVGGGITIALAILDMLAYGILQRTLDVLLIVLGAWAIVEALAFGDNELKWWSFATACAIAAVSAIGLAIHEMTTERVVHELAVTSGLDPAEGARGYAFERS